MFTLKRWDMRLTDREVLITLANLKEPTSQSDIAETLGCNHSTVARAIRRLKAKGYIQPIGDGRKTPYEGYRIFHERLPESIRVELETGQPG